MSKRVGWSPTDTIALNRLLPNFKHEKKRRNKGKKRCNTSAALHTLFFFYKNLFYKNVEAEIDPNFKNVLRTFLRLRVD